MNLHSPLFRAIPELYLHLDIDMKVLDLTDFMNDLLGGKREQIIGQHVFEVFPEGGLFEKELIYSTLSKAILTKKTQHHPPIRYDMVRDGKTVESYWRCSHIPVLEDGEVTGILCKTEDMTQQTILERDNSAEILDHISDGFFTINEDLIITNANQVALSWVKSSRSQVVGQSLDQFSYRPQDGVKFRKRYKEVFQTGVPQHFTETYDGYTIEASAYRTLNGDVAIFYRDVSHKKRAEEHLSKMLQAAPVAIALMEGQDLTFSMANDQFYAVLGYDDVIGKTLDSVTKNDPEAVKTLKNVLATNTPIQQTECTFQTQDGRQIYVNFVAKPFADSKGEVTGVLLVCHDVTELVTSRKRIEEALKMRDEFLSLASHELKTPLTSLQLQIEVSKSILTDQRPLDDLARGLICSHEVTQRGIKRLSDLVDDMLDISRISNGKLSLNLEPISLNRLVYDVIERLMLQLKLQNVRYEIFNQKEVRGHWDPFRLEQVIVNIVSNALKYAGNSPIEITVTQEGAAACLIFKDHGPGIAKENHAKVFQRFERIDGKKSVSGLGLGLFICQEIIQRHGGKIGLESELGEGATFKITLPLSP